MSSHRKTERSLESIVELIVDSRMRQTVAAMEAMEAMRERMDALEKLVADLAAKLATVTATAAPVGVNKESESKEKETDEESVAELAEREFAEDMMADAVLEYDLEKDALSQMQTQQTKSDTQIKRRSRWSII